MTVAQQDTEAPPRPPRKKKRFEEAERELTGEDEILVGERRFIVALLILDVRRADAAPSRQLPPARSGVRCRGDEGGGRHLQQRPAVRPFGRGVKRGSVRGADRGGRAYGAHRRNQCSDPGRRTHFVHSIIGIRANYLDGSHLESEREK